MNGISLFTCITTLEAAEHTRRVPPVSRTSNDWVETYIARKVRVPDGPARIGYSFTSAEG